MVSPPPIPFDVLLEMMDFLPPSGLVALLQTCKTLRKEGGKKLLLRMEEVDVAPQHLSSFCRFMLVDDGYRISFLRQSLCLRDDAGMRVDPETPAMLVEILSRITGLRRLRLECADWLFVAIPDLSDAISGMTCLQEFTMGLRFQNDEAEKMLLLMQSQLKSANIMCGGFDRDRPETMPHEAIYRVDYEYDDMNPIVLLANSSHSLERVTARNFLVTDVDHGIVYPNVTHLDLFNNTDIWILPFIRAFPNIGTLTVANERTYQDASVRSFNWEGQLFDGKWDVLDTLVGTAPCIYNLSLLCHVRSMVLDALNSPEPPSFRSEMMALSTIIADTRPSELIVRMRGKLKEAEKYVAQLQTIPHQLTSMGVTLRVKKLPTDRGLTNNMRRLIKATPPAVTSFMYVLVVLCKDDECTTDAPTCLKHRETLTIPEPDEDVVRTSLSEHPGLGKFTVRIEGQHSNTPWFSKCIQG
ncbi:hypothetical protein L227DRAFT_39638 [Lentinus tigrinus ALCF2SS1-6]|uniref:F-box domain-containing protein n=1 Tax=Lentinus tigrinus ALCF2SS1-6 TaxID=1328759 RepID=A0A5C2RQX6_9APHY|nr:hypothetical protein L227DRAFT_39638 [Lentinus tigrinus ALCF2SS1-6]